MYSLSFRETSLGVEFNIQIVNMANIALLQSIQMGDIFCLTCF